MKPLAYRIKLFGFGLCCISGFGWSQDTIPLPVTDTVESVVLDTTKETLQETFDSNLLRDPQPEWPVIINPLLERTPVKTTHEIPDTATVVIHGYRVQIFATQYSNKADSMRQILEDTLDENVYVPFEAPNYKVRVGDCLDRREAERLRDKLKAMGYRSAWIIRTRIQARPAE